MKMDFITEIYRKREQSVKDYEAKLPGLQTCENIIESIIHELQYIYILYLILGKLHLPFSCFNVVGVGVVGCFVGEVIDDECTVVLLEVVGPSEVV